MTTQTSSVPPSVSAGEHGKRIQPVNQQEAVVTTEPKPVEFCVRLHVRERPQGTELFAAIASSSLLLVTYVLMRILQSNSTEVHTDVVVAIIALPATLAAMAVFFVEAVERTLFVSRAGMRITFCTAILATVNVAVFAIQSTDKHTETTANPEPQATASHQGAAETVAVHAPNPFLHWFWYGSLSLIVVLVIASVCTVAIRIRYYTSSLRP